GSNKNQNDMAPEVIVASAVLDVPSAFVYMAKLVHDHQFKPHAYWLGMNEGIVSLVWNDKLKSTMKPETVAEVARVEQEIRGGKSKVELIKAVARKPAMLILDEPTSVLAPTEAAELFAVMRRLAAAGTIVVFISHKIPEVLEVATRVVVMRAGKIVAEGGSAEETANAMVSRRCPAGRMGAVPAPGEIVAIVGVAGNGQSDLAN